MSMKTKCFSLMLVIVLSICIFSITASAEPIDYNKKGSIAVSMKYNGESITSGSFTIFQVASLKWNIDKYDFKYTEQFSECGIGFEKLDSDTTAKNYANFVEQSSIEGTKLNLNEYGIAVFTDLPVGLYLVIQEDSADGYEKADPFLITLPIGGEDGWVYELDASPKLEIEGKPKKPPSDITQTGQLKWPIPVLAISGIAVFTLGWALWFSKRKSSR